MALYKAFGVSPGRNDWPLVPLHLAFRNRTRKSRLVPTVRRLISGDETNYPLSADLRVLVYALQAALNFRKRMVCYCALHAAFRLERGMVCYYCALHAAFRMERGMVCYCALHAAFRVERGMVCLLSTSRGVSGRTRHGVLIVHFTRGFG